MKVGSTPMALYHQDGFVAAWKQATQLAGPGGRIATMPDLIEARLNSGEGAVPWESYFTTLSAEYLGLSKGGLPILIVAHGLGPLSTLDGIQQAYSYQYKDKQRNRKGGRISQPQFRQLEEGHFGPVDIVELNPILKRYKYPFMERLSAEQAMREPLMLARLGPRAVEYLEHHAQISRQWHLKEAGLPPHNPYGLEYGQEYLDRRQQMHLSFATAQSPVVIAMEDSNNLRYSGLDEQHSSKSVWQQAEGGPVAHLLSMGQLSRVHGDGIESLSCDISLHDWNNGTRLLAIPEQADLTNVRNDLGNVRMLMYKNWPALLQPVEEPVNFGFQPLIQVGDTWFTQYPKTGSGLDTWEPEFHVTNMKPIGSPVKFITEILGYHAFFKYNLMGVRKLAPPQANAYVFTTHPDFEGPDHQSAMVQFYRVEVDTSARLIRQDQLVRDLPTMLSLID